MRFDILLVLGALGANAAVIRSVATTAPRADGRCGIKYNWATCATGTCCSQSGYCGTGSSHCAVSSGCQLDCTDGTGSIKYYGGAAVSSSTTTMKTTSTLSTLVTSITSKISSSKTSTTSASATSTGSAKAVFAHYMVGGMTAAEAVQDVQQTQAMGLDAFALNVQTTDSWCTTSVGYLFSAAQAAGFKLFFSADMSSFSDPSTFIITYLKPYYSNSAYYQYKGLPFVSTFYGGTLSTGYSSPNAFWQAKLKDVMNAAGMPIFFVPAFSDASTTPSTFFANFPVVDGQFNWDASWPWASQGMVNVSSADDVTYITSAKSFGKTFMMGISALQFKHMSTSQNWYRRGGLGLALRIPQILSAQPNFVEIQTWNDAGESHYIGPVWPEAISGTDITSYTDGFDHTGWQQLLTPFMKAFKAGATSVTSVVPTNGKSVQGVFWHSTLLSSATCSGDSIGKVSGLTSLVQDVVETAVMVASGVTGAKMIVTSNGVTIGTYALTTGLNAFEVPGMTAGVVSVKVVDAAGNTLMSGTGSKAVAADASYCNYNPQVVALA